MSDFIDKLDFYRTDSNALVSIQFIVMALAFGLIIAFIAVYYQRRVIGSFVRAIRNAEANDEESAKTLAELGQENNVSAIAKLKKSSSLRSLITICNADASTDTLVIDENTRFYIAKEKEERSRKQFGDNPDSLLPIIIGSVVLLIVVVFSFFLGK